MKLIVTAPLARYCGAMIVMMIVVTGAVRAEPVFSFDATPGKLPKTVVPISYSIELRPDAESLALPGVEVIDIEVREPTARLTLNAVNTTFASVTADDSRGARRRRARCRGRDGDVHFRAAARSGRASAAHRVYGADQQVRPRFLLRRLSDRQRREAAIDQQARAGGRAADISVLGRAGLQGEFRPDRDGAAPFPRGRQHAGRARRAARAEPEERHLRADAEDVDLPVRADGGRTGAHHGGGGRRDDRCRRHHRQGCERAVRARQRGETAGLVQRLFRRQISAAQARPDRGARRLRRRDGELGRHHLLREPAAVRSRNKSGQRAARHLRHHRA